MINYRSGLVAIGLVVAGTMPIQAQAGCAHATLVTAAGGKPAIRVLNNCRSTIRFEACIATSSGWPNDRARVSGKVAAGKRKTAGFNLPATVRITDTGFEYAAGGQSPRAAQCF